MKKTKKPKATKKKATKATKKKATKKSRVEVRARPASRAVNGGLTAEKTNGGPSPAPYLS